MSIKKSENEINNFFINKKFILIALFSISLIGFVIRLSFVSYEIPVTLDALIYFWYAIDFSQTGIFPSSYSDATNNLWPTFLGLIFSLFNSENFLDFMNLQKIISVIFSVLTGIPIYLLCSRFVNKTYAIFGVCLFMFEPRIIENSILGITEPMTIFMLTFSIYFFLKREKNFIYISFALLGLTILARAELFFVLIIFSIVMIFRDKKFIRLIICLLIVFLIMIPMINIRIDTLGNDGIFSRFIYSSEILSENAINRGVGDKNSFGVIMLGLENYLKFFSWSLIPTFIIFIPIGLFNIFKNRNEQNKIIIFYSCLISIPIIFAFGVASDSRFLFSIYPIFCIISSIGLQNLSEKIKKKNIVFILSLIFVLSSSIIYLENNIFIEHELEAIKISEFIFYNTDRINYFGPEMKYVPIQGFYEIKNFPIINSNKIPINLIDYGLKLDSKINSINELIIFCKKNDITHLVIKSDEKSTILSNIYSNEDYYSSLTKIFDSEDYGFDYKIKIFKILF